MPRFLSIIEILRALWLADAYDLLLEAEIPEGGEYTLYRAIREGYAKETVPFPDCRYKKGLGFHDLEYSKGLRYLKGLFKIS